MRALEYRRRKFVNPNVENHARLIFPYIYYARSQAQEVAITQLDHHSLTFFVVNRFGFMRTRTQHDVGHNDMFDCNFSIF